MVHTGTKQCQFCKGKAGSPHTAEPRFSLKANKIHPLSQCWDSSLPCSHWPLAKAGPRGVVGVASWRQTLPKAQRHGRGACGQVCPSEAIPGSFPLWKQFLTYVLPTPNALLLTTRNIFHETITGLNLSDLPSLLLFHSSPRSRMLRASYLCILEHFHSNRKGVGMI